MKEIKALIAEQRVVLRELAVKAAREAEEHVHRMVESIDKYDDHGVSCVNAIEALARCQRLLGALGQNAKVSDMMGKA